MATPRLFQFILLGSLFFSGCKTPAASAPKLVGGAVDEENRFPAVLVWTSPDYDVRDSRCTGSKISERYILTAAHCVVVAENGRWVIDSTLVKGGMLPYSFDKVVSKGIDEVETLELVQVLLAPTYNYSAAKFQSPDVAVLEIVPRGEFALHPTAALDFSYVQPGDLVVLTGYGQTVKDDATFPTRKSSDEVVANDVNLEQAVKTPEEVRKTIPQKTKAAKTKDLTPDNPEYFFGALGSLAWSVDNKLLPTGRANLGSGDSGGPVFRRDPRTRRPTGIVGVNSYGVCPETDPECQATTNSFFARLNKGSKHRVGEWLEGLLRSKSR